MRHGPAECGRTPSLQSPAFAEPLRWEWQLGGVKVTLISMLSARRKDKGAKKDIPEWKRLLLEQDEPAAAASSSTAQKRPREEEAPAPRNTNKHEYKHS